MQGPEGIPSGMTVEQGMEGTVYAWRPLAGNPFLVGMFLLLAAPFVLLGPSLVLADVLDRLDVLDSAFSGAAGVGPYGAVLCTFTLATGRFFLVALLGRCRLTLSPSWLDYEVRVLGHRMRKESRRVKATRLRRIAIKEAAQGGIEVAPDEGAPFYLKLPVGAGAISVPELIRLKERWLAELGAEGRRLAAVRG